MVFIWYLYGIYMVLIGIYMLFYGIFRLMDGCSSPVFNGKVIGIDRYGH
jgi:hypothetical protein